MTDARGDGLLSILDELAALLTQSRQLPMSASILVNKAEALDLLNAARSVVPQQVAEADEIVAGAKDLVDRAEAKAAEVVRDAERKALRAVEKEAVVEAATLRAEEIVAQAETDARRLTDEANAYCDRQFAQIEDELEQIARQVSAGRRVIQARREETPS